MTNLSIYYSSFRDIYNKLRGNLKYILKNKLFKKVSWGVVYRTIGLVISFSTSIILARTLGVEQFGKYAFILALTELFTLLALFGSPSLLIREVAHGISTRSFGRVLGILNWTRYATILMSFPLMIIAFIIFLLWQGDNQQIALAIVPTFFILLTAISRQATNTIQGNGNILESQILSIIVPSVIFFLVLTGSLIVFRKNISLINIITLLLISQILTWVIIERKKKQYLPVEIFSSSPEYYSHLWFKSALPLMFVSSTLLLNTKVDILMLQYFYNSTDVGLYRVAQRAGQFMLFGIMAVDVIINPLAAKASTVKQKIELQQILTKSILWILWFALPLLCLYVIWGQQLIKMIYGAEYIAAWIPMIILSLGSFSQIFFGRGGIILTMSHYERYTVIIVAIGALWNIFLNLQLIPRYGINGAAFATATALVLRAIVEAILTYHKTGFNTTIFALPPKI
ncbi:MAG: hypothetical protein D3904_00180 [Candidatus Electrothrix sp. EH2]|nr:hypothetical protein [Candidatus Electrothrix sp. EH2]